MAEYPFPYRHQQHQFAPSVVYQQQQIEQEGQMQQHYAFNSYHQPPQILMQHDDASSVQQAALIPQRAYSVQPHHLQQPQQQQIAGMPRRVVQQQQTMMTQRTTSPQTSSQHQANPPVAQSPQQLYLVQQQMQPNTTYQLSKQSPHPPQHVQFTRPSSSYQLPVDQVAQQPSRLIVQQQPLSASGDLVYQIASQQQSQQRQQYRQTTSSLARNAQQARYYVNHQNIEITESQGLPHQTVIHPHLQNRSSPVTQTHPHQIVVRQHSPHQQQQQSHQSSTLQRQSPALKGYPASSSVPLLQNQPSTIVSTNSSAHQGIVFITSSSPVQSLHNQSSQSVMPTPPTSIKSINTVSGSPGGYLIETSPTNMAMHESSTNFAQSGSVCSPYAVDSNLTTSCGGDLRSIASSSAIEETVAMMANSNAVQPTVKVPKKTTAKTSSSAPSSKPKAKLVDASKQSTAMTNDDSQQQQLPDLFDPKMQLFDKASLEALVKSVDPYSTLEDEVADAMLLIADDFIGENASLLSKHRGSNNIESKDICYTLSHGKFGALAADPRVGGQYYIAGPSGTPAAKRQTLVAHKQRMALIDKNLKKV